jgi:hypothetical protein
MAARANAVRIKPPKGLARCGRFAMAFEERTRSQIGLSGR